MRFSLRLLTMVLVTALTMLPFPSAAQNFATYTVYTVNKSPNRAWITIQDLGKTRNLDWGWVEAGNARVGIGQLYVGRLFLRSLRVRGCERQQIVRHPGTVQYC